MRAFYSAGAVKRQGGGEEGWKVTQGHSPNTHQHNRDVTRISPSI